MCHLIPVIDIGISHDHDGFWVDLYFAFLWWNWSWNNV